MATAPADQSWRWLLGAALAVFLLTRVLALQAFPIFNDEALYLQYAQSIHADWAQHKFVSMDNRYGDWKPPLQYWLAAPVIGFGHDPLVAGRAIAVLYSFIGFIGFFLFTRELFGEREGVLAAWLYVLCPTVLFHNDEFIAETFLFSTAPFVYWTLLKAMRARRGAIPWLAAAALFSTALLLFKQSGFLLLVVALFLPCARWRSRKGLTLDLAMVVIVILCAQGAAAWILPAQLGATKAHFNSRWVMAPREILRFPLSIWAANLRLVSAYIGAYFSWLVPLLVGAFLALAIRRRSLPELTLAAMCLAGAATIILFLRGFNEYLFNTAIIAALLPLLARSGILLWNFTSIRRSLFRARSVLVAVAGILCAFWIYQIVFMISRPAKYIERSTPWAAANYLHSWSTGFGIKAVVELLAREQRPGIVIVDPQWGNPRTALEVYRRARFPNLQLRPITGEFFEPAVTRAIGAKVRALVPVRFVIYSADGSGERRRWQQNVEREICVERSEVRACPEQMPLVVCRF